MIFIFDIYVWEIQFLYFHLIYLKVPMLVHNNALDVLSIGRQKHGPFNRLTVRADMNFLQFGGFI